MQCIVIGHFCVFATCGRALFVCGSVTTITQNCVHRSSPKSVGEGNDHLQLIKFWPSCAPGRGSVAGRKFFAPPYYSQCAVFASLRALFSFEHVYAWSGFLLDFSEHTHTHTILTAIFWRWTKVGQLSPWFFLLHIFLDLFFSVLLHCWFVVSRVIRPVKKSCIPIPKDYSLDDLWRPGLTWSNLWKMCLFNKSSAGHSIMKTVCNKDKI